ncbi:MAG TPA: hypothetical protein DHW82_01580 [Spirochaetia bacterium]|nr:MAG: hypothetical protein A2Y41_00895 [Spirochaetes bacterium GWB1_36_13]HCL55687.1 hypothetical protein [Spirochaetia bacterium]
MKKIVFLLCFLALRLSANPYQDFQPDAFQLQISPFEKEVLDNSIPFFHQALIVSGIQFSDIPKYQKDYETLLESIGKEIKNLTPYQQADKVLKILHEKKLKRYEAGQTEILTLFDKGLFNCVSSSLFYNMVMTDLGFPTRGVLLPDHVFSEINIDNKWYDAETTVAPGFDAGSKKEVLDDFKNKTGFVYVPLSSRGKNTVLIPNKAYLALIYSNTAAVLIEKKDFIKAINSAYKAMLLFPEFVEGAKNLQAAYNQYALDFISRGKFIDAEKLLLESLKLFPALETTKHNLKAVYTQWLNTLFQKSLYEDAFALMDSRKNEFTQEEKRNYYLMMIQNLVKKDKNYPKALEAIQKGEEIYSNDPDFQQFKKFVIQEYSSDLKKQGKQAEALKLLETYSDDSDVFLMKILQMIQEGKIREAKEDILKILYQKPDENIIKAMMQVSYEALRFQKPEETKDVVLALVPLAPRFTILKQYFPNILSLLGQYYYKNGQASEGIDVLNALYQEPFLDSYTIQAIGDLYYNGILYPLLKQKNYEQAAKAVNRGIELTRKKYPMLLDTYRNLYINLGAQYYQEKEYAKAYQIYVKLMREFGKHPNVFPNFKAVSKAYLEMLKSAKSPDYETVKKEVEELMK